MKSEEISNFFSSLRRGRTVEVLGQRTKDVVTVSSERFQEDGPLYFLPLTGGRRALCDALVIEWATRWSHVIRLLASVHHKNR